LDLPVSYIRQARTSKPPRIASGSGFGESGKTSIDLVSATIYGLALAGLSFSQTLAFAVPLLFAATGVRRYFKSR
jgi:hypothetical protein